MAKVLIVDDSPVVRKIARRILESLDLRADEARSDALASCAFAMPDALFVDASLPNMDGYEFVRRIRSMAGGGIPWIVFCASENNVSLIARATHAGANDFLVKPFDRARLVAKFANFH